MKQIFDLFIKFSFKCIGTILFFLIFVIIVAILSLLVPFISGSFIDFLITSNSKSQLWQYCFIFAILSVTNIFVGFFSNRIYIKIRTNICFFMNKKIFTHLQNSYLNNIKTENFSRLTQQIDVDTQSVTSFCLLFLQNIILYSFKFFFSLLLLLIINIKVFLILVILMIMYIGVYFLFKKPLYMNSQELKNNQSIYFSRLFEQLSLVRLVKTQGVKDFFDKRVLKPYNRFLSSALKTQKIQYIFTGLDALISTFAQIALFIVGGLAILQNELTVGQFTVISTYFAMILGSIRYFFGLGKSIQDTKVSTDRINNLLKHSVEVEGNIVLNCIDSIKLCNITFSYSEDDITIFKNFSYNFVKNKIYGIIGKNGIGKSTLIGLILGLFSYSGNIYFNDITARNINMSQLRKTLISVSDQNPLLLEGGTLKENLALNNVIDRDELDRLIGMFELNSFVNSLENGLDSMINQVALSGGELVKLSLIRAFLKKGDLIILDEPTTGLDQKSQNRLLDYLNVIRKNRIIILITHDKQFALKCDDIINLNNNSCCGFDGDTSGKN